MNKVFPDYSAIGLLGGSFDPIHKGHLHLAEASMKEVRLERIIFIPASIPPHKTTHKITDPGHRLEMIRRATAGLPWIEVDEREIQRGGISYTVETVNAMAGSYPRARLYFIIGSDSLAELHTWLKIREIAEKVTFITLEREGRPVTRSSPELEAQLRGTPLQSILLPAPPIPISSTLIRSRIAQGLPVEEYLPESVVRYIAEQGLYQK